MCPERKELPELFRKLIGLGCLQDRQICGTDDGFCAAVRSVSDLLAECGITTVPSERGNDLECRLFFDDWYLYAIPDGNGHTYSLFKMREQEHDEELGLNADGDIPGVTISFIAMRTDALLACMTTPSRENRLLLSREINRVVAAGGQCHSAVLKRYFVRTEAQGPYLIAKLYTDYIASLAQNGVLPVSERYADDYRKQGSGGRVPRFLEENNKSAGRVVCDHEKIYICDPNCPTMQERLAILATCTGNVSFYSFAAEVQFHAKFLTWWAKVRLPVIMKNSPYASAVRADMSIGDAEFTGPTPYYRPNSRLVKRQYRCNKNRMENTEIVR